MGSHKQGTAESVQTALKDIDRKLNAALAAAPVQKPREELIEEQEHFIAEALNALGPADVQSLANAVFCESSALPAHREAARRWFAENPREAKKARFVLDRFDGLARLNQLKAALEAGEAPKAPEPQPAIGEVQLQQAAIQLTFLQPSPEGDFPPDLVRQIEKLRSKRPYIFLAFPPKCGGTFLRDILGRAAGASLSRPGHAFGGRDVSPYLPSFAAQMLSPTGPAAFMTHAHMIGYYSNIQILNLFGIKPVVMKRSIPDMLRSFYDQAQRESHHADGRFNWTLYCGVYAGPTHPALGEAAKKDFFVYHQAPWYIQFYASWIEAERLKLLPIHWVGFDDFRANPEGTARDVLAFYGLSHVADKVPGLVKRAEENKQALRFNKGVAGRGATFLERHHLEHLHRLAAGYPEIDFVAEGLLPPL